MMVWQVNMHISFTIVNRGGYSMEFDTFDLLLMLLGTFIIAYCGISLAEYLGVEF